MALNEGLNIDFQGTEGHGAAQIFGDNKNIDIYDDYLKKVSDDIAKKKADATAYAASQGFDPTKSKVWSVDTPYFIKRIGELTKMQADFSKKYADNPRLYNSPEYFNDAMALKNAKDDLIMKADQSAQAQDYYTKSFLEKYNEKEHDPQSVLNAKNFMGAEISLRPSLMGKPLLRHTLDEPGEIKKMGEIIPDIETENYKIMHNGVEATIAKNQMFLPNGSLTDAGKKAMAAADVLYKTPQAQKLAQNWLERGVVKDEDEAHQRFISEVLNTKDKQAKKTFSMHSSGAAPKEDKSKPKVSGNTLTVGNNVWTRRVLDDGKETFVISKTDVTNNKPLDFEGVTRKDENGNDLIDPETKQKTSKDIIVTGYPTQIEKSSDGKRFIITVIDADGNATKVDMTPRNSDKIKNEYGLNPFEARKLITGGLDVGEAGVGTAVTGVKTVKSSVITPKEFEDQWAKLPPGGSLVGPDGKTYRKKK